MKNPGIGLILAGIGLVLFFVLDAVFSSGMRERERYEFQNRGLPDIPTDAELPDEDPYAAIRE